MKLGFNKVVFIGFIYLVFFSSVKVKAQDWEFGAMLGTSGYMGEYNPDKIYKFNSLAGSIGAKYNLNSTWGVRGGLSVIGINGKANYTLEPGLPLGFESKTLIEFSILPEFNFIKFEPSTKRNAYTPYVFAGPGFRFDKSPKKIINRAVILFGGGFKYNLKGDFSLDSRLTYGNTTDMNLDDIASLSASSSFFDKLNTTDSYMTFQVGITYTIFKQGCPTW